MEGYVLVVDMSIWCVAHTFLIEGANLGLVEPQRVVSVKGKIRALERLNFALLLGRVCFSLASRSASASGTAASMTHDRH